MSYIPALKFRWLTPIYDFVLQRLLQEQSFKSVLVQSVKAEPNHHILDLGCGTGTLTIMLKKTYPDARVTGLDADPDMEAVGLKNLGFFLF